MHLLDSLLPLVLTVASVAIVFVTYIRWAIERAEGSKPLPLFSRIARRMLNKKRG